MTPKSLAHLLRVISTERRIEILQRLLDYPDGIPVSTLGALIDMPDGPLSFNLKKLAEVGLVLRQPNGRFVFYTINRGLIKQVFEFFQLKESETNDH